VIVPPEFRDRHRDGFERAMAGGERSADAAPFHLPILRADQTVAVVAARFVFLDGPHGRLRGAMIIIEPAVEAAEPFTAVPAAEGAASSR
jgi:hypothetical protein